MFFPEQELFSFYPYGTKEVIVTTFYDIFDGYYHVTLKLNVTVTRNLGIEANFLKYLRVENNNTAPYFAHKQIPIFYLPPMKYVADLDE